MRCCSSVAVNIGILALQGDVSEHIASFRNALAHGQPSGQVRPVRRKSDFLTCDGLVLPGGESTTLSRLIERHDLFAALREYEGGIFATCAGMVLLSTDVSDSRIQPLGIMDMTVERNAFGRQKESFEADLMVTGVSGTFHAIFIRAPIVTRTGPGVEVLSRIAEGVVGVRQGLHMAFSFHPELGGDLRLHHLFLEHLYQRCR
jgi:5'-phosphate synthase pdxT subunit